MRKLSKIILFSLLGLIAIAIILPILYKEKIIGLVKHRINNQINGQLNFSRSGLSLFRSFPNLTLSIYDLKLSGADSFARMDLFRAKSCRLTLNLIRLIKYKEKGIQLNKIVLEQPYLHLITLHSGLSNLEDIYKTKSNDSGPESNSEIQFLLKSIRISGGSMDYLDLAEALRFSFNHLDHHSSGTYSGSTLTLKHENTFDSLTYASNDLELLSQVKGTWQGHLVANLDSSIYTLTEDQLRLNELQIKLNLFLQLLEDRTRLNLSFETAKNDVKQLISLIPGAYQTHFDQIETSGEFKLSGTVNGDYAETGCRPMFDVQAKVNQGMIKYTHLPYPIQNIQFDLHAQSLDTLFKQINLDIPQFSLNLDRDRVEGNLEVRQQDGQNKIKGYTKANLNLNNIAKALPMDSMQLSGTLDLNLAFDFNDQDIQNKQYDRLRLSGKAIGENISVKYPGYPMMHTELINAKMDPKVLQLVLQKFRYGRSDLAGNVDIMHPLAWFSKHQYLSTISAHTSSQLLDLDEISNSGASPDSRTITCDTCINYSGTSMFIPSVSFQSSAKKVIYKDYDLKEINATGTYARDTLTLKSFEGNVNQSNLSVNGRLDRPYQWSSNQGELTGWLTVRSNHFFVDPWMEEDVEGTGATTNTPYQKKLLPRTTLNIYPEINQLSYGKYLLKGIKGTIVLNQQALEIHDGSAALFSGKIKLAGLFNETGPLPLFNFKLDLERLGFGELFNVSTTFAKFAPIAEFIEGVFSSSFVINGGLDNQQIPIWQEVDAAGVVETFTGLLSRFKPLKDAAARIKLPILDLIKWEKSRNWFEVVNGLVIIKPFTIKYQGFPVTISGSHRLNQDINYDILWQIPRHLFDKYKIGLQTNEGLNWLRNEIKDKGLDIGSLDTIFINMNLKGSITHPVTQFKWILDPGQSLAQKIKDQLLASIDKKADSLKADIIQKAEAKKDSIIADINQKVDEQKQKLDSLTQSTLDTLSEAAAAKVQQALDSITKSKIGSLLDSSMQAQIDTLLGKRSKEEIDKINDKLKNWNPFKKKPVEEKKQ